MVLLRYTEVMVQAVRRKVLKKFRGIHCCHQAVRCHRLYSSRLTSYGSNVVTWNRHDELGSVERRRTCHQLCAVGCCHVTLDIIKSIWFQKHWQLTTAASATSKAVCTLFQRHTRRVEKASTDSHGVIDSYEPPLEVTYDSLPTLRSAHGVCGRVSWWDLWRVAGMRLLYARLDCLTTWRSYEVSSDRVREVYWAVYR